MNNKNLYLYLTFLSAISFGAKASSDHNIGVSGNQFFSGSYVTGSIGHSNLAAQKKSQLTTGAGITIRGGKDFSSNSLVYAGDFGRGSFFNSTYMCLEGGVFRDGHRSISSASSLVGLVTVPLKETLTRDQGVNFKVKVGRLLSESTLCYGSLGFEYSRFTYHASMNGFDSKKSKSVWGVSPGMGVRTRLSDNLSLDLNYNYALCQNLKIVRLPVGTSRVNAKIRPRFSAARIGLSIKL